MKSIYMVKQLNGSFLPAHDSDLELARKLKAGEVYKFQYSKPRNYEFHKKFFALMDLVFDNQEHYTDRNKMRKHLTIEAGFWHEEINYITGVVTQEADSINFASMDEDEFGQLYRAMLDTVIRVFGWEGSDIEANVAEFM
jgi:hypothetical protein